MDAQHKGVKKRTGKELVASDVHQRLRNRILTLEIKSGTRLVEDDISVEFNVGRTPVREALLRLQGEGLVSRKRGWVVEQGNPADIATIFESRMAVEGYATRLAATRRTDKDLAALEGLIGEMDAEGLSRHQLNQLNRRLHEEIVAQSRNSMFVDMYERTQFAYWNLRLPVLFTREQIAKANLQHRDILKAMLEQDADRAEALARLHIETTYDIVRDALEGF